MPCASHMLKGSALRTWARPAPPTKAAGTPQLQRATTVNTSMDQAGDERAAKQAPRGGGAPWGGGVHRGRIVQDARELRVRRHDQGSPAPPPGRCSIAFSIDSESIPANSGRVLVPSITCIKGGCRRARLAAMQPAAMLSAVWHVSVRGDDLRPRQQAVASGKQVAARGVCVRGHRWGGIPTGPWRDHVPRHEVRPRHDAPQREEKGAPRYQSPMTTRKTKPISGGRCFACLLS